MRGYLFWPLTAIMMVHGSIVQAQSSRELLLQQHAGDWTTPPSACLFPKHERSYGEGWSITGDTLNIEFYEGGERGQCDLGDITVKSDGIEVSATCQFEEFPAYETTAFFADSVGDAQYEPSGAIDGPVTEAGTGTDLLVNCDGDWVKTWQPPNRHCTVIDQFGMVTDAETCSIRLETCKHPDARAPVCIYVQWPSGGRSIVESVDYSLSRAMAINGRSADLASHSWLPETADCVMNSGSGNTLCLTRSPLP